MSRGPVSWKESDVKRAIKAAQDSGLPISKIEFEPGKIVVVIGKPAEAQCETKSAEEGDPWANVKLGQN